ncbi:MAG: SRPBCC family protein [Jatrophihabitans sp.]|nr:MAG: SRPBCC family protein [Jatrophihabitans sp.]
MSVRPVVTPVVFAAAGALAARALLRNWGATKAEVREVLPGDELVPDPAEVVTRAVTVDAPAAEVWRWLVQIGQDRGGMYSYTWLENLAGLHIRNAEEVREQWQHLAPGDEVRLVPRGWLGMPDGYALAVAQVIEGRAIVLQVEPWHAVWSFHVLPHGPGRCRLLSRSRAPATSGLPWLADQLMDPITFLMTRRMLLGIKSRAEGRRPAA